jgi:UDP-N-acetylglucosamine 4,6-dehydratase
MRYAITGATGFFGMALTQRLLDLPQTERVRGSGRDEHKKARMVERFGHEHAFQFLLADIREAERLRQVFNDIDTVIHCAALKRVDNDDDEAIEMKKTNVDGTQNVIEAAMACGVKRVLFLSSDKACTPENAYGKSKAMAEEIAVAYNSISYPRGCRVAISRWGNVLWSTGSVLCKWQEAKDRGEPFRITDPKMTRFVLTVDQAVDFVLLTLNSMTGGEIFLPRLPSVHVTDLATALDPDWKTEIVGRRPGGEKIGEILIGPEEMSRTIKQGNAYVIVPSRRNWSRMPYHGGPIAPDWRYASETNDWWLTMDELRALMRRT